MDGTTRQGEANSAMLHRIVALLFALADIAENAADQSPAIRRIVLWILYPAESVARGMVLASSGPAPVPAARTFLSDGAPEDALRLAVCFRTLALMLEAIALEALADTFPINLDEIFPEAFAAYACLGQNAKAVSACCYPDTS